MGKFVAVVIAAVQGAAIGAVVGGIRSALSGGSFGEGAAAGASGGALTGGALGLVGGVPGAIGAFAKAHPVVTGAGVGGAVGAATGEGVVSGALSGAAIGGGISGFNTGFNAVGTAAGEAGAEATLGQSLAGGFRGLVGIDPVKAGQFGAPTVSGAVQGGGNLADKFGAQIAGGSKFGTGAIDAASAGQVGLGTAGAAPSISGALNPSSGFGFIGNNDFNLGSVGFSDPSSIAGGSLFNQNAITRTPGSIPSGGVPAAGASGGGGIAGGNLGQAAKAVALALATRDLGPQPPSVNFDPTAEFETLRTFLGDQRLPQATEEELISFVETPIAELGEQFRFDSDRQTRLINETFDRRDDQIRRRFAQFGQSELNSSEAKDELRKSQLDRSTALDESQQEFSNITLGRAIQAKQFALSSSLQQNQFDDKLAFELAELIGVKAELEAAIQQNDFNTFQDLMSQILSIGFGSGQLA